MSHTRRVLWVFAFLGALLVLLNHDLPFVRNDLVYAHAAWNVIEHGFDPRPVVADSALSYDKPIGFAWLGAPLVALLGAHVGLRVLSLLGALAFLLAARRFLRVIGDQAGLGWNEREHALALALVGFNPIVVYQCWSAHPDGLFAALVLAAWTCLLELVHEPRKSPLVRALFVLALCCVSLVFKNYAVILLACAPILVVLHARRLFARGSGARPMLIASGIALAVFAGVVWSGRAGWNPLVRITGEGGGAGQYATGDLAIGALGTMLQVVLCLVVNLGIALLFALHPRSFRFTLLRPMLGLALPYVVGLMAFPTSYYNMRYFLPLLPFGALLAVQGWRAARPALQGLALRLQAALALGLIGIFNLAPIHAFAQPILPKLTFERGYGRQGLLDNLRIDQHRARAAELAPINRTVEQGGQLYLVNCRYYGDAQHGVYERDGLLRADIETRYVSADELEPQAAPVHAWLFYADPRALEALGDVTELGPRFYRITPRPAGN